MTISNEDLTRSYRYCRDVARKRAGNFYYSFVVLPREKSNAMCAMYAFMRYCDDIADDPGVNKDRVVMLEKWRESLERAARGDYGDSLILPAFHDAMTKFSVPLEYFHQLIDGAGMDMFVDRYRTFDELYDYCYKVASVVGLVCIHIFGFDTPIAKEYAEHLGIAFQLTNILRDIKEDATMGRIYIPEEDLWAFDYSAQDLLNRVRDDRFYKLMAFEVLRARCYYKSAVPLMTLVHESGRAGLFAMIKIYSGILDRIERRQYDIFASRISLTRTQKMSIAARAVLMHKLKGGRPYLSELRS